MNKRTGTVVMVILTGVAAIVVAIAIARGGGEQAVPATATPSSLVTPFIPQPTPLNETPVVITLTPSQAEQGEIIQYRFIGVGRFAGQVLGKSEILLFVGATHDLWAIDRGDFSRHLIASQVRSPIAVLDQPKRVVYATELENDLYEIWSSDWDGSGKVRVGTTVGDFPRFSVASNGVVLLLEDGHLVLKNINGTREEILTAVEEQLGIEWEQLGRLSDFYTSRVNFSLSPDGQMVAIFDGDRLWVISIDGSHSVEIQTQEMDNIPDSESLEETFIKAWSPDSQRIAYFEGVRSQIPGFSYGRLKIVDVTDRDSVYITPENAFGGNLAWSPDGRRIAYSFQYYTEPDKVYLYVMNADGSSKQLVTTDPYSFQSFAWLPDSTTIAFGCQYEGHIEPCIFTLTGGHDE